MRVFVTGATGFVGEAVVRELAGAGHTVVGLARQDAGAEKLRGLGAEVVRGDLNEPEGLADAARASDGVLHLGFVHNFEAYAASLETDRRAAEAMLRALEGTRKPFVYTSALAGLAQGRPATEEDRAPDFSRGVTENAVLGYADRGVRAMVVRLAASVHGRDDYQFVPMLIQMAREKGVSAYIGEGGNEWPAVYREDAARLYRLALEKGESGARFHGVGEDGLATRRIAEAIAEGLGVPVRSIPAEGAEAHFGWMGRFFGTSMPATSALTRAKLGWEATGPGLFEDMKTGGYFEATS